jgi:hypothetical protein
MDRGTHAAVGVGLCRYDSLLHDAMFRRDPAVLDVMNIAEAYPACTMEELPYFDGDNWPDILDDIIKCVGAGRVSGGHARRGKRDVACAVGPAAR